MFSVLVTTFLVLVFLESLLVPALTASPGGAFSVVSGGTLAPVPSGWVTVKGSSLSLPAGAAPLGNVGASTPVSFTLELNLPNTIALQTYEQGLFDPSSPYYHHYIPIDKFATQFGPSASVTSSLVSYLTAQGLTVSPSGGPLLYHVSGSAGAVESALHFSLADYRDNGQVAMAPTGLPALPASLAPSVLSFQGLDQFDLAHPSYQVLPQLHASLTTPSVMRGFYDASSLISSGDTGSAWSIGLAEMCDPSESTATYTSDLNQFDSAYGLPSATINYVGSGATTCSGGSQGWGGETDLDIQWAHVMAPGATLYVCLDNSDPSVCDQTFVTNAQSWHLAFGSNSWGGGGPYHSIWQAAMSAGVTLLASSGDACAAVDYPAAEPDGIGVGGTSITPSGSSYGSETAWSCSSGQGTGGGCDTNDAPPSWQTGMPGLSTVCPSGQRGDPDVAMDADPNTGVPVYTNGQVQQIGGTSLACPMWAASLDLIYESSGATGFAAPTLYSLAKSSLYTTVFHEITSGSNGQYSAGPGWNAVTGVGSPDVGALAANWAGAGGGGGGGGGSPLTASSSASPTSGTAPLTVSFTGSASGGTAPYTYSWSFGDGSTSTSQSPSHTHTSAGSYSATLTVTDSASASATSGVTVSVASSGGGGGGGSSCTTPTVISIGTQVSGSATTGGCALYSASLTQSQWNSWYYLNAYETDSAVSGTQPVFTVYAGMGSPPTPSSNSQSQAGPNAAMAVNLNVQSSGQYGGWGTYEFLVQASTTGSGSFCFELQLSNSAAGTSPACSSGGGGGGGSPLSASASATPISGTAPLAVSFQGSASGGTSPYTYSWAFGDGTTSTAQNPSHTYSSAGTFSATLTVKDSASGSATSSVTISVTSGGGGGGGGGTGSCAGSTYTVGFGTVKSCSLAQGTTTVLEFTLSQSQWNNYYYINVYESDGTVTGSQPVFQMGTGMGGTPAMSSAQQTASGPNAQIQIDLYTQASGQYGGWGTYWAVITASGGSGGFCFEPELSNGNPGGGPACTASLVPASSAARSSSATASSVEHLGGSAPTIFGAPLAPIALALLVELGIMLFLAGGAPTGRGQGRHRDAGAGTSSVRPALSGGGARSQPRGASPPQGRAR